MLNGIDRLQVKEQTIWKNRNCSYYSEHSKENIGKDNHILNYLFSSDYNITNKDNKELYISNTENEIGINLNNEEYIFNGVEFSSYYSLITHLLTAFIPEDALCFLIGLRTYKLFV